MTARLGTLHPPRDLPARRGVSTIPVGDRDALDALFDEGVARADDLIDRIEGG